MLLWPTQGLPEHSEHLLGGDDEQAEGQMGRHLHRAAHADMPPAVLFVEMAVDPLNRRRG